MRPLWRIEAPYFVAGFELTETDTVANAARVIHYMLGWPLKRVRQYCMHRGWKLERVE